MNNELEELQSQLKSLLEENIQLKIELQETKEHLKKYTAPTRCKKYYETHKEELLDKMKLKPISSDKRKEYNKKYYLKKKQEKEL
jgi:regulator of replication initiation timing